MAGFGVAVTLLFLRATRMRVELAECGVAVYRLFTTRRAAWQDISDVRTDYFGLHIVCRNGTVLSAGSMGKPNWSKWLGHRTSADERVDHIRAAMDAHTRSPAPDGIGGSAAGADRDPSV